MFSPVFDSLYGRKVGENIWPTLYDISQGLNWHICFLQMKSVMHYVKFTMDTILNQFKVDFDTET